MLNHIEEVYFQLFVYYLLNHRVDMSTQHIIKMDWVISVKVAVPFVFNSFVVSYLYVATCVEDPNTTCNGNVHLIYN